MAAIAEQLQRRPPEARLAPVRDPNEVVAVVLADGTIRDLRAGTAEPSIGRRISSGTLSGPDWTLWWQRRSYTHPGIAPA